MGMRKSGNQGLVTTTGGGATFEDLVHTLPVDPTTAIRRSAIIRKILLYNNTGANVALLFGTMSNAVVPAFVQVLPTLVALNALDNVWLEAELPEIEFQFNNTAAPNGRSGDIWVQDPSAGGILIQIEVEEIGEAR